MYQKWDSVLQQLKQLDNSLIAYSGGTDSSLLLKGAAESKIRVLAVTARAEIFSKAMLVTAQEKARELGIPHKFADLDIFHNPKFVSNPPDKCYHCKKDLILLLKKVAREKGYTYILDGTNADDIKDYRPGLRALSEEGVISPLKEAGLTKKEIIALTQEFNLPVVPEDACLASRLPYGERISAAKLHQIELGEGFLRDLGFKQCRVRHHGSIARIEVPTDYLDDLIDPPVRLTICDYFESLGFTYTTLDLGGYVAGSMNKPLGKEPSPWTTKE